jgi:hypothetical protein
MMPQTRPPVIENLLLCQQGAYIVSEVFSAGTVTSSFYMLSRKTKIIRAADREQIRIHEVLPMAACNIDHHLRRSIQGQTRALGYKRLGMVHWWRTDQGKNSLV